MSAQYLFSNGKTLYGDFERKQNKANQQLPRCHPAGWAAENQRSMRSVLYPARV